MILKEIYSVELFKEIFNSRSLPDDSAQVAQVMQIINEVRKNKDQALRNYAKKFDGQEISDFKVPENLLEESFQGLEPELKEALKFVKDRILAYEKQIKYENRDLGGIAYQYSPIERVGFYVPGGKALYPSTVLMSIVAAKVAGVPEIYALTPTYSDHNITFATLYLCGVRNVYRAGGAQAIAALAYGTESIPKVDKIVGPGNSYVALAKKLVFGDVGIDSIAGPSEILLYVDRSANPKSVVLDLFAQAEHDVQAKTFLLSEDLSLIKTIRRMVIQEYQDQPRSEIIGRSLSERHFSIVGERSELIDLINEIAPEHVSVQHEAEAEIVPQIRYAGAVFEGGFAPEAIGDYVAGPSHVLPTNRNARFSHGLNVNDFMTSHAVIRIAEKEFREIAEPGIRIAEEEGLFAHAASLQTRLPEAEHDGQSK